MEAELGRLGGVEDDMSVDAESAFLTDPQEAKRFVELTGVDSLAVAIGTAHGLYSKTPKIDFQRLAEIREVVDVPLVLHGASDVPDEFVRRTIELGVTKVNVATELKIAFAGAVKAWGKGDKLPEHAAGPQPFQHGPAAVRVDFHKGRAA